MIPFGTIAFDVPPAGCTVEPGILSASLALNHVWRRHYAKFMLDRGIVELNVNYAKGFVGSDLRFLDDVPFLEGLTLVANEIQGVSRVHGLHKLRALNLSSRDDTAIDFRNFPNLAWLGMDWRTGSESLFECHSLQRLWLGKYPRQDTNAFARLRALNDLTVASSVTEDLKGIGTIRGLKRLGLHYLSRLYTLDGIEEMYQLEELTISVCRKLTSIRQVQHLSGLRSLAFNDCGVIDTVAPIANLSNLEVLQFYGTTRIADGDISPLLGLRNLRDVRFQNRRQYNVACDAFPPWSI